MSESEGRKRLRAPRDWEQYEHSKFKWSNIRMKEVVYTDLPPGAEEAIEDLIKVRACSGAWIEKVHRLDPQTVEIVWYNDSQEEGNATRVRDGTVRRVRETIQTILGEHWEVERKEVKDSQGYEYDHPQRVLVRRVSHQNFKYSTESDEEFKLALHGRPDGVPDDASVWGDLDEFPEPPETSPWSIDIYVHETGTGTKHLIGRRFDSFREKSVAEEISCECGLKVQPEDVIDTVEHYGEFLQELSENGYWDDLDPETAIGEDLCDRCWVSYAENVVSSLGKVLDHQPPTDLYDKLLPWRPPHDS